MQHFVIHFPGWRVEDDAFNLLENFQCLAVVRQGREIVGDILGAVGQGAWKLRPLRNKKVSTSERLMRGCMVWRYIW